MIQTAWEFFKFLNLKTDARTTSCPPSYLSQCDCQYICTLQSSRGHKQLCTSWMTSFQLLYHGFHSNSLFCLYLGWRCWLAIKSHLKWGGLACRRQGGSLQLLCTSFRWPFLLLFIRILKAILRKMGDLREGRIQQNQFFLKILF